MKRRDGWVAVGRAVEPRKWVVRTPAPQPSPRPAPPAPRLRGALRFEAMPGAVDLDFIALQSALAGHYSIERELGRGGMGAVYLAREVQLDRPVAIKVLPPALATRDDLRARFVREARTAAQLSHPNIVPIFRVDEIHEYACIVMAYIEGETLTQRVRARGPLAPAEAVRVLREIAWALAYAHARGVVHRDIKPDNILLERGSGRALVTDFGIAHVQTASALTEVGQVLGTAHYMSPEQAAGEPLDGRSDLYALGVVAYFVLSGTLPFDGPTMQSVLAKHLTQQPPPLPRAAGGVPKALADVVERCLAKDREHRFPSGEELAEALALAQEQRREAPAPVRVWLQKGDGFKAFYPAYMLTVGVSAIFQPGWISTPVKLLFPLAVHALVEVLQTRRVMAAGYDRDTLVAALRDYVERRREELAFEYDRTPPVLWKLVRWATYGSLGVAAAATAMLYFGIEIPGTQWYAPIVAFGFGAYAAIAGGIFGLFYPGRRVEKHDTLAEFRLRAWRGRAGDWLARLAAFRLRPSAAGAPLADRPTEVAIGVAAADLFAALPRPQQQALHELPDAVKRLEDEARAMRRRVSELDARTATVRGDAGAGRSSALGAFGGEAEVAARRADVLTDLAAARDRAGRRLATAVAALENIRLDLLRLHAGAGDVQAITEALHAARRIGGEVDAALAARDALADGDRAP